MNREQKFPHINTVKAKRAQENSAPAFLNCLCKISNIMSNYKLFINK